MEPNLPRLHRTQNFRSEREYNEWRRETFPRYLMESQEGVLRRALRHLRSAVRPREDTTRSESEGYVPGPAVESSPWQ
jgi:hypothetical protein